MLKATGAEEETRFLTFVKADPLTDGKTTRFTIRTRPIRAHRLLPTTQPPASGSG